MAVRTLAVSLEDADVVMVEPNKRSMRRHHLSRVKQNRRSYWGHSVSKDPLTDRQLGMVASTPAPCSCWMCSKPRKHTPTVQELRAQQPALQESPDSLD